MVYTADALRRSRSMGGLHPDPRPTRWWWWSVLEDIMFQVKCERVGQAEAEEGRSRF